MSEMPEYLKEEMMDFAMMQMNMNPSDVMMCFQKCFDLMQAKQKEFTLKLAAIIASQNTTILELEEKQKIKPVDENTPKDKPILVYDYLADSDLGGDKTRSLEPMLVEWDPDDNTWVETGGCYYSVWTKDPKFWAPVPQIEGGLDD